MLIYNFLSQVPLYNETNCYRESKIYSKPFDITLNVELTFLKCLIYKQTYFEIEIASETFALI